MIGRSSLYSVTGGDTIQMVKTAEALQKLGVTAEILLSYEKVDYDRYDVLHFFNLLRPADHLKHIRLSRKPYLISTIYLDYSHFDHYGRSWPYRLLFSTLGTHKSEYLKNIYRYLRGQDRMVSAEYLAGHRKAMLKILKGASMVLPNSTSELNRLARDTGYTGKFAVIPNGIDPEIFGKSLPDVPRLDKVLCVGQIYGMKNQHMLIKACENLDVPLELIGKAPPNHAGYYDFCRKIAGKNVKFIDFMPQDELLGHYAGAKVHALPSWFETTGLASLEAGAMGCNLVAGKGGDTYDYFGEHAWYCEANDLESLVTALQKSLARQTAPALRELILAEYTWSNAALKTKEAYSIALNG